MWREICGDVLAAVCERDFLVLADELDLGDDHLAAVFGVERSVVEDGGRVEVELSHHVCHRVAMGSLCGLLDAAAEVLERNVGFAGDILEEALSVFVHLAIFVDSEDQEFLFCGVDAFAVLVPFFLLAAFEDLGAVDFGVRRTAATDLGDVDAGGADFSGGVGAADFLVCADADVGTMAMRYFGVDGAVLAGLAVILP